MEQFERLSIPRLGIEGELPAGLPEPYLSVEAGELGPIASVEASGIGGLCIPRLGIYGEARPLTDSEKSDFLKKSAGTFGLSGHIKFTPGD